ncbi:hypothetical protein DVR12_07600 [Chitinophaga silvatica]|uniref:CCDC81-like prokaryotic HU domain-containing protein n=1 Tax=Chitinophaga silvatica TaxID=2282649 RepID=A0A3E1YEV4_9BACT|nr:hypothetical protein [Chitinophaga silvatica]RFS25041.1 hypothetical protein DVR12_07600 [Chitinophaga silvatica]
MILLQYVQEVLFKQRVCVVPYLGTFSIQHFPAFYNTNTQTLTPPRDQIMFTQQWQDDGSCVEWIALKENLVPAVAQRKFEKYLEELKEDLKLAKPLSIPGVGQLLGDFAGNVHFYPEELPAEFDTIDISPIERAKENTAATPPPPAVEKEALEPIMTPEVENDLELVEDEGGFKWWWAVVLAVIILGGLGAWWYVTYQSNPAYTPAPADSTSQHMSAPPVDTTATQEVTTDTLAVKSNHMAVIKIFKDSLDAAKYPVSHSMTGRKLVIYKRDSLFYAGIEIAPEVDTSRVLDTISRFYGRRIYMDKQ